VDKSCGKPVAACEKSRKSTSKGPKPGKNPALGPFPVFHTPSPAAKIFSQCLNSLWRNSGKCERKAGFQMPKKGLKSLEERNRREKLHRQ